MHATTRNLLAFAVAAALAPALALADKPTGSMGHGSMPTTPTTTPTVTLPTPAVEHAGDALQRNPKADTSTSRDVGKDAADHPRNGDDADDNDNDDGTTGDDNDGDDGTTGDDNDGGDDTGAHASAAQTNPGKGNWWADADTDNDGRISRTEASANAGLDARFATVDTNSDGFVTRDEYQAYYTSTASKGEQHAAPQSAVVTRDVYARLDANHDGKLTAAEVDADAGLKADFGSIDANHDGFVSDDEYRTYYRTHH
jgi:hypothetical protein